MEGFDLASLTPSHVQSLPRAALQALAKQCGLKARAHHPQNTNTRPTVNSAMRVLAERTELHTHNTTVNAPYAAVPAVPPLCRERRTFSLAYVVSAPSYRLEEDNAFEPETVSPSQCQQHQQCLYGHRRLTASRRTSSRSSWSFLQLIAQALLLGERPRIGKMT